MRRYFIKFSYLGSKYRGLQKNVVKDNRFMVHDVDTVQGALESAFSALVPKSVNIPRMYMSSRTDVGVHALYNLGQIDLETKYDSILNPEYVLRSINRYLVTCNHDIRLLEFIPVKPDFYVRHLVKSRTYMYRFCRPKNQNEHRIPIGEGKRSYCLRSETFDLERLKEGTKLFMGVKNFQTYSARKTSHKPIKYVRELDSLTIEEGQTLIPFDTLSKNFEYWNIVCSAKSFLYNQVRRMVGALLALATGTITEKDITVMFQVPGHRNWISKIQPVPGHGLYLVNVEYCEEELNEYYIKYKPCPDKDFIVLPEDENEENCAQIKMS